MFLTIADKKQEAEILFLELFQQALYNKENLRAMRLCKFLNIYQIPSTWIFAINLYY